MPWRIHKKQLVVFWSEFIDRKPRNSWHTRFGVFIPLKDIYLLSLELWKAFEYEQFNQGLPWRIHIKQLVVFWSAFIMKSRKLIISYYSVMKSDGNSFCGSVVLNSFNMKSLDENSILYQIYIKKYSDFSQWWI